MGRTVIERLETRLAHLERLGDPGLGRTVDVVNDAFARFHQDGSAPASILLRRRFLARRQLIYVSGDRDKTPRLKPALATLVAPKGLSLRLELTLLFLVQCGRRRSSARIPLSLLPDPEDPDSLGLISLSSTGNQPRAGSLYKRGVTKMRTAQVTGALDTLEALGLVEMEKTPDGRNDYYARMWLNREFGPLGADPERYKVPPANTDVVSIPIEFFTQGWIQVMTDSEIANWLMWRDLGQMRTAAVTSADDLFIDAELRLGTYDITRDAWDTHLMLDRFGLMSAREGDLHVGKTPNGSGYRREPHRFDLDDAPLKKSALPVVKAAVVRDLKDRLARRGGST